MKNALFVLTAFAAVLFSVACSEKGGGEDDITYHKSNTWVAAWTDTDKMPGAGELAGFYMIIAGNATDECLLTEEAYISIEMCSGNELKFIDGYVGPDEIPHVIRDGALYMTRENIYLEYYETWNPSNLKPEYDYYRLLPISAVSGVGTYEFALKFYQPKSDKYFITPAYQMEVSLVPGGAGVITKTILVN